APADSLRSVVRRVEARDWHVRLSTADGAHSGRVTDVRPDTVLLVGARVALVDVTGVERRLKEGGGGVIGAVVGGLAIGVFGLAASSTCESGDCTGSAILLTGGGAMIGGLFGALVGTTVAPPRERWEPLW